MSLPIVKSLDRRPLTDEEVVTVSARAKAGDHAAQMRMVGAVSSMIMRSVFAAHRINPQSSPDDLFQEVALLLIRCAIPKYDPTKAKWVTYATWWIRAGAWRTSDSDRTIRIPPHALQTARQEGHLQTMRSLGTPSSLDAIRQASQDSEWSLHDCTTDEESIDIEEITIETEQKARLVSIAMRALPERHAYTLLMRLAGYTFQQVADRLGCSRELIRKYDAKAYAGVVDHLATWPRVPPTVCPGWRKPCDALPELEVGVCVDCFRALEAAAATLTSELAPIVARTA